MVKYDIFYVKQFVRYLHEIFCVIFCHYFAECFVKYVVKFCCVLFQEIFCVIFLGILHTFHIFHTRTECFNNSTYFTILYTLFHSTSLQMPEPRRRARPGVRGCQPGQAEANCGTGWQADSESPADSEPERVRHCDVVIS